MKKIRKISKKLLLISTIFLCILSMVNAASACSCFTPSTALWAFDESENVGIFQIQSVEKYAEGEKGYGYKGYKQAVFKVQKVYKGNLKVGETFSFRQGGGGDCVLTFDEGLIGKEMLLYLDKKPQNNELWEIFICSRSQFKNAAAADLYYLDNMKKYQGKTRISGTLTKQIEPSFKGKKDSFEFLSGIKVNIRGNGKNINLKTDRKGVYEIYGLPSGKYVITPEKINGFKFSDSKLSETVELTEEDHEGVDFDFEVDNRISGTVFDSEGKPLTHGCLTMFPIQGEKPRSYDLIHCVDENGKFKIDEIPPGTYVIQIEIEGKDSNKEKKTFYFPAALNRDKAAQITVNAGTFFDNFNIIVP